MGEEKADNFIQERLNSLHSIDTKIVSLLSTMSDIFETCSASRTGDISDTKKSFENKTNEIYNVISKVAIDLRKEVKIMDENIGVYDRNKDSVMILPIEVNQKNTRLGENKLSDELALLNELLDKEKDDNGKIVKKEETNETSKEDDIKENENDVEMTY